MLLMVLEFVTVCNYFVLMMNKKIALLLAVSGVLVLPVFALGAGPSASAWITTVLDNFLVIVLWPVFAGLVIIMLIYAGIMYLTANGDATKVHTANKAVLFAVVGIVVALLGFGAINFIKTIIPSTAPIVSCDSNQDCVTPSVCCTDLDDDSGICSVGVCYTP